MKTLEYSYVDKSSWGEGPWSSEADKLQWLDEATGLPCLIVRHSNGGQLCGYVGVSREHPHYEQGYDAPDVDVHGGLTFANHCAPGNKEHGICHVVEPGEDDNVWWLGFDCAHLGDLAPGHEATMRAILPERPDLSPDLFFPEVYRDVEYVRSEVRNLAHQLKGARRAATLREENVADARNFAHNTVMATKRAAGGATTTKRPAAKNAASKGTAKNAAAPATRKRPAAAGSAKRPAAKKAAAAPATRSRSKQT